MLSALAQSDLNNVVDESTTTTTVTPSDYSLVSPQLESYTTTTVVDPTYTWISFAIAVLSIVAMWRIFTKAKQPGWAAIVPIYNLYVLLKVAGRPGWWLLLYLIPFVNIVIHLLVSIDLAKAFGKSTVFGVVGLFLFAIVGYVMLAFGKAEYKGVHADMTTPAAPAAPTATPPAAPAA